MSNVWEGAIFGGKAEAGESQTINRNVCTLGERDADSDFVSKW